jgi:exopolysaccharide biosynthesis polyprenyl glycosylphosphotransferase
MSTLPRLASAELLQEQVASDGARGGERYKLMRRLLALGDVLAGLAAGLAGAMVADTSGRATVAFVVLTALAWPSALFVSGLYALEGLGAWASAIPELGRLLAVSLLVSWPVAGVADALGGRNPVLAALVAAPIALALGVVSRTGIRATLHRIAPLRQRTVILGSGVVAAQLAARLRGHAEFGLDPVGVVDDHVHEVEGLDLPTLGRIDELRRVLRDHQIDRVIIAFSLASHEQILESMRACREEHVAVDVVPRLFELLNGARALEQIGGLPLLSIGAHRLSRTSAAAKRALDMAITGLALVVLSPLLAVVAAAIVCESRGGVFFRQTRMGRHGETFQLVKFRSMYRGADAAKLTLVEHNDIDDGVMFKIHRDPRVTRIGRVIRRLSIDELPQLINVLKGEMSLVGPRPLVLPEANALGESWHARRLELRPGLTGPWQVSGRSDLSVHDMVRLDFQYVTGWSLARDIEILLATVPVVLSGRGAY